MTIVGFAALAALGTLLRAFATAGQAPHALPLRTLVINTIGAFALGVVTTTGWWNDPVAITVGGLGSLTTFSTVVGQTAILLDDGHRRTAIAYVGLTVVAGVAAAWLGLSIGEQL